ncbi:MAG: hypothetical protein EXR70_21150 [Deltaproteobacteria bacterium]|nr:hypothetical protein [Deltaproteobacteria bacterium]
MKPSRLSFVVATISLVALVLSGCNSEEMFSGLSQSGEFKISDPNASYFDREGRFNLLRSTQYSTLLSAMRSPRSCEKTATPEPIGFLVIPMFYENPDGYATATAPLQRFEAFVTDMAEFYLVTRDATYARCVASVLEAWAGKDSLLFFDYSNRGRQAWYNAVWTTVSAGLAYSIIRDDASIRNETRRTIDGWLNKAAKKHISLSGGQGDCCNNHAYWRGLEAAISGVVSNDRELFLFAINTYRHALTSMNRDGSFPLEMDRSERALHYQNFALLPLVYTAEIANRQGIDLYSLTIDGKSLHTAIAFLLKALDDPDVVKKYTNKNQDLSFAGTRLDFNWMEPYAARFPNQRIESVLTTKRPLSHRYGGGNSTLYFYDLTAK